MRVEHSIFSTHMLQSVRVVSLTDLVEVELSSSRFCILILSVIAFKIPKIGCRRPGLRIVLIIIIQADQGCITLDSAIFLAWYMEDAMSSTAEGRRLQLLALTDIISKPIGLTVNLTISLCVM